MATRENSSGAECKDFAEDLVLFHYGELDELACKNVQLHLKSCAACRDSLDGLRKLMAITIARDHPPESFWSDYRRELRHKLDAVAEKPSWWKQIVSWIRPLPMPVLAACALVVLALTFTFGKKYWENSDAPVDDEMIAMMSTSQDLDLLKNLELLDALDVLEAMGTDEGKG